MIIDKINNPNDDASISILMGIVTAKDNDTYKVIVDDVIYTNIRSLNKIDYNIAEKVIILCFNDLYFILGSYDKKHTGEVS